MRVCIDLDSVDKRRLDAVLERAHYLGFSQCEIYETGKGYHLIFRSLRTHFLKVLSLKRMLLDDPMHCELDAARGRQVLWTKKLGRCEKYLKTVQLSKNGEKNANVRGV